MDLLTVLTGCLALTVGWLLYIIERQGRRIDALTGRD